ncbi:MAG: leader peptidase (prepilin peptidase) / N-methyltransferase [Verrucomicrobiota bacterium]|jgi:leader peptidase (prepilin peptidase)/N-methyltransferase|nr:leader peptidase (prepilin peptidase) / N-methyltransferase [Verrucomicrobiota bacterium]MDK2963654.1 leader peptidase (prepilin peptidase) / N-methyltransferase [Verrucomicrobiota bacterium]
MTAFWAIYWLALVFILGLCLGSFLNVCICRIPHGKSVVWPPSSCPNCNARIKWYDNIPVLSWFLLGAKCRNCKLPISVVYPVIELLTGFFFLTLWLIYGFTWFTPIYQLAVFGLLLGTFIDLEHLILPDCITIGGMILFPILSALFPPLQEAETWRSGLTASLIGLAVGFGLFWTIRELGTAALKKEAMGLGDVKLMGALGALLGWQAVLYITFFSALIGSVAGISLIALHRKGVRSEIPYGPYMALAAFSWILGGFRLWEVYLNIMGF